MRYRLTGGDRHSFWWQLATGSLCATSWCAHCDKMRRHLAWVKYHHPLWRQLSAGSIYTNWLCAHWDEVRSGDGRARPWSRVKRLLYIDDVRSDWWWRNSGAGTDGAERAPDRLYLTASRTAESHGRSDAVAAPTAETSVTAATSPSRRRADQECNDQRPA